MRRRLARPSSRRFANLHCFWEILRWLKDLLDWELKVWGEFGLLNLSQAAENDAEPVWHLDARLETDWRVQLFGNLEVHSLTSSSVRLRYLPNESTSLSLKFESGWMALQLPTFRILSSHPSDCELSPRSTQHLPVPSKNPQSEPETSWGWLFERCKLSSSWGRRVGYGDTAIESEWDLCRMRWTESEQSAIESGLEEKEVLMSDKGFVGRKKRRRGFAVVLERSSRESLSSRVYRSPLLLESILLLP